MSAADMNFRKHLTYALSPLITMKDRYRLPRIFVNPVKRAVEGLLKFRRLCVLIVMFIILVYLLCSVLLFNFVNRVFLLLCLCILVSVLSSVLLFNFVNRVFLLCLCILVSMLCSVLLFNFANPVFLLLCLCILIVMYVPF